MANLNADLVDGASIVSNRITGASAGDDILDVPGFGHFKVESCFLTGTESIGWTDSTAAYVFWADAFHPSDIFAGVQSFLAFSAVPNQFLTVQLARNLGASMSMATVTVTGNASDCTFAAQAVVRPG